MKITLDKAITYNKTEYKELEFDFEGLTGADVLAARSGLAKLDIGNAMDGLVPQLSMEFQARLSAVAAKVPYEVITMLSAKDFMQVTNEAKNFLLPQV